MEAPVRRTNGESDTLPGVSLKLYSITFDLFQPGDYASLLEKLRTLGASQTLDRQWALRSTLTASQLRNTLRDYIAAEDRIVVTEVGGEFASRRARSNLAEL